MITISSISQAVPMIKHIVDAKPHRLFNRRFFLVFPCTHTNGKSEIII